MLPDDAAAHIVFIPLFAKSLNKPVMIVAVRGMNRLLLLPAGNRQVQAHLEHGWPWC